MGITHSLRTHISRMTSSPQRAMKFIGSGFRHTKQAIYNTLCRLISAIAINKAAELALDQARADAARAATAARGLRSAAALAAARCDRGAGDTAAAGASAPAADPGAVLADVLVSMEQAGRAVAAVADARGVALDACVGAYRALTAAP